MRNQKSGNGRAASMPAGLAVGAAVSMALTMGMAAILAKLVQTESIRQDYIGYGIMIILLTSSFLGAAEAQRRIKHRRLMVCGLAGLIYFLILLSVTALFFGGQYNTVGVTALLVMGGAGSAALVFTKGRGGTHKRKFASKRFGKNSFG